MPSPAASGAHGIAVEVDVQARGVAESVLFAPLGDLGGVGVEGGGIGASGL
jgi:hypothetical protein